MTEVPFKGVTVDTRYTPLTNLLAHVEGSNWAVDYYAQVLDADSELGPQQTDRPAAFQQYVLIKDLEIKVTSPLTGSQDPVSKEMTITGNANVYGGIIPNKGDTFLADIGDGREGVFAVITSEKKTYLKDSVYVIEYELKNYSSVVVREDLNKKTIKTTHFVKDFINLGLNPQLLSDEYNSRIVIQKRNKELIGSYLADFFSIEHHTLIIPGQGKPSYDPFLSKAILDWLSTEDHPFVSKIRLPSVSGDQAMRAMSFWDCLSALSMDLLPIAFQKARLIDTLHFRTYPQMRSIYFTTIRLVLYPEDRRTDVDSSHESIDTSFQRDYLVDAGVRFSELARLIPSTNLQGIEYQPGTPDQLPDIVPVTYDEYYVLSEGFYTKKIPLASRLEVLLTQALNQETLNIELLLDISSRALNWDNLERFYYYPILFVLFKTALRSN